MAFKLITAERIIDDTKQMRLTGSSRRHEVSLIAVIILIGSHVQSRMRVRCCLEGPNLSPIDVKSIKVLPQLNFICCNVLSLCIGCYLYRMLLQHNVILPVVLVETTRDTTLMEKGQLTTKKGMTLSSVSSKSDRLNSNVEYLPTKHKILRHYSWNLCNFTTYKP